MTVIYQTTITRIGAVRALSDQMLITFREERAMSLERVLLHSLPRRVERCTPSRFAIFTRAASLSGDRCWQRGENNELGHVTCASMV